MKLTRRKFLVATGVAGGALALGFALRETPAIPHTRPGSFQPNAWLQITEDGQFIFQLDKVEMGQGVMTSMPATLAEELDLDPARLTVEFAGVHPKYKNPILVAQVTGGSTSTMTSWEPLRQAGATARAMLVAAAAAQWRIRPSECRTDDGEVINTVTGMRASYASLVPVARGQEVPKSVVLKSPEQFRWIGRSLPRRDVRDKSLGKARFGMDVNLPGMLTAVIVRCPHFGGKVSRWEPDSVRSQPGVRDAFEMHTGIAIVADTYWQARRAAGQLQVSWDKGPLAGLDSAGIRRSQEEALAHEKPHNVLSEGDIKSAFASADQLLEARYAVPFFHHSPMEPQNCTVCVRGDSAEVWVPSQSPDITRALVAQYANLSLEKVTVNTTLLGGGFGRRGYPDFAAEAAAIAKHVPRVPVKLVWSREDDMQHDFYRPATLHHVKAAVREGRVSAWQHTFTNTSVIEGWGVYMMSAALPTWVPQAVARSLGKTVGDVARKYDPSSHEGALLPYAFPNRDVNYLYHDRGIPSGFWRSVAHSFNGFVVESFVDELAHATGQDPAGFRAGLLQNSPRDLAVLRLAAEKAGWGKPASGRYQGIAVHASFGSYVAQVAEVSVQGDSFRVERIVCAVDCGQVINPEIVTMQIESAVVYGLTAAIKPPVTIRDGACEQSNFHDLPVLRMNEMPEVEVYLVQSAESPMGVGEIGVPPVAPAVANALFAATGQRLRELPLKLA